MGKAGFTQRIWEPKTFASQMGEREEKGGHFLHKKL
jgi:hypothetical protein